MREHDLQALADLITEHFHSRSVIVKLKTVNRGHAHFDTRLVSIPKWAGKRGEQFAIYYVVHEACHVIAFDLWRITTHGDLFKNIEKQALALWGLTIEYKRAYPAALSANGERVYRAKDYK